MVCDQCITFYTNSRTHHNGGNRTDCPGGTLNSMRKEQPDAANGIVDRTRPFMTPSSGSSTTSRSSADTPAAVRTRAFTSPTVVVDMSSTSTRYRRVPSNTCIGTEAVDDMRTSTISLLS
eukprot:PhM_4_TR3061/c0_g1_i1/m.90733